MMKLVISILVGICTFSVLAQPVESMSESELIAQVQQVTRLQNKVLKSGSTVADADALFSMYSDDFEYVHEKYGGRYSRELLYRNTVNYLKQGKYNFNADRYKIIQLVTGENAVAVLREQTSDGEKENHLSVFEFKGKKVRRIKEYW